MTLGKRGRCDGQLARSVRVASTEASGEGGAVVADAVAVKHTVNVLSRSQVTGRGIGRRKAHARFHREHGLNEAIAELFRFPRFQHVLCRAPQINFGR